MDLLSIIVPCYNEEKNVEMFLDEIQKTLVGFNYEVIFINDGSRDNTQEKIMDLADSNPTHWKIPFENLLYSFNCNIASVTWRVITR